MLAPGYFVVAASIALAGIFLAAVLWGLRKTKGDRRPIGIGIVAFVLFALFCENIFHQVLMFLFPALNEQIAGNLFLYVLYGCAMAAFFEEGGRYYAFSRVIQSYTEPGDALGYGVGHGGIELLLSGILGLCLTVPEPFGAPEAIFWTFERTMALTGHIALSLIVFTGVRLGRKKYAAEAVGLHMLANVPIGLYKYGSVSLAVCEAAFTGGVLLCVLASAASYRRLMRAQAPAPRKEIEA